jgi:membrane protease YdiL (CAAX protease family)
VRPATTPPGVPAHEPERGRSFVDASGWGAGTGARYLLGAFLIFIYWQVAGTVVSLLLALWMSPAGRSFQELIASLAEPGSYGPLRGFVLINMVHPFLLLGLFFVVRLIHRRTLLSTATARPRLRLRRILQGFGVWWLLCCLSTLVDYALEPASYTLQWDAGLFAAFLPLALLLTPIQTTAEELFFRGYLIQALSRASRTPLLLVCGSGFFFTLPHLANPEMGANPLLLVLIYFLTGAFLAIISLRDGSLELAIGVHAANNLFSAVAVTFEGSVFDTPALFHTTRFDPAATLVMLIAMAAVFYMVFWRRRAAGGAGR